MATEEVESEAIDPHYLDPSYYSASLGKGENNLLELLPGRDQKHGGRVQALLDQLQRNCLISYDGESNTYSPLNGEQKLRWLDIGAGSAPYARLVEDKYFPIFDIVSLDFSTAGITFFPYHQRPQFIQGNAFRLPILGNTFDIFTAYDLIEHIAEPRSVLEEGHRVLKPGGLLNIVVPSPDSDSYAIDETHVFPPIVYTEYFRTTLEEIGFKNIETVTRGFPDSNEHFEKYGTELFRPEGGNHIYVYAWKDK